MSEPREQLPPAGHVDVRGDPLPDPALFGLKALGAYRSRQLTLDDALASLDPPLLYFPELYEVLDREIGYHDEVPESGRSDT